MSQFAHMYPYYRDKKYYSAKATIDEQFPEHARDPVVLVALAQIEAAERLLREHFANLEDDAK